MAGIQRLYALLFPVPNKNLADIKSQKYEILNKEPLHDISHHTQNLFDELPYHALKKLKQTLKKVIHTSFNGKEAKNSVDCRRLLVVVAWLIQNYPNHFITDIITMFAEIQEILYAPDIKQSIQSVLFRLPNITFHHALLLKMTSRRFFGSYYHSLVKHSPEQYRMFPGRLANTEKEEATFNFY